ncbi:MAG: hypothetical protein SFX73_12065 [Kofleriaceae bacterium]|nr:hypothetical protein [Kofleriaceae bacterium]
MRVESIARCAPSWRATSVARTSAFVHLSIQNNHLHLLVEAADREAITRNMQSFEMNAARAINRVRGSSGKVFALRYRATQITTPRQARRSLAYVLQVVAASA